MLNPHCLLCLVCTDFGMRYQEDRYRTRQSKHCGFSIYIFDNSKSKSMVRLVRAEKMVLSGLVFSRMGADRQNIVLGFWLTTFFCPFRFLKLLKQRPIIKNSFLTNILWFLFTSSRTK